jgi:glucosyl-3-phosphoglycerate synthase
MSVVSVGEKVTEKGMRGDQVRRWFNHRSYDHAQFAHVDSLARRKRDLGLSISAVLPAREVAGTIGPIVESLSHLQQASGLVDQVVVVDAHSQDGTAEVAHRHGVEVHREDELLPQFGRVVGKGDAMWRALSVARGDIVLYLDSDTTDFGPRFAYGVLGPLLSLEGVSFVKALYNRPLINGDRVQADNGARVTELTAKPLLNRFYPELAGFAQPLAGEVAAPRELLCSIPFLTGYGVETGMLIDVLGTVGLDAMAQVDLGLRVNRNQSLFALSKMSYAVLLAVESRLRREGRLPDGEPSSASEDGAATYLHSIRSAEGLSLEETVVEVVERPPLRTVVGQGGARRPSRALGRG